MALNWKRIKYEFDLDRNQAQGEFLEAIAARQIKPEEISLRALAEAVVAEGREWVQSLDPRHVSLVESGNAVDTAQFANITGQVVYSKLLQAYEQEAFVISKLVDNLPTQFNGERIAGIGGIGDQAELVGEGKPYPLAGLNEDYIDTPMTEKRGLIVPVTKEAIFFDRTGFVLKRAAEVGEFLGVNKEKRLADALADVNNTRYRYKWRGTAYGTFQTSTPWINDKTSNALVDWTNVNNAEQLFANMLDPNTGEPIVIMPNTLLVCPELLHTAKRVVHATDIMQVDNQANASTVRTLAPNTIDNYAIVTSRFLRARLSLASAATSNWYLGDFRKALCYMENWPLSVVQAPSNSEAEFTNDIVVRYKASERGTPAVIEPRAIVRSAA